MKNESVGNDKNEEPIIESEARDDEQLKYGPESNHSLRFSQCAQIYHQRRYARPPETIAWSRMFTFSNNKGE